MAKKFENFNKLINSSKELSKKRFLKFAKGIFDVNEKIFEHLWNIPIIASCEDDSLIPTTLATKSRDNILEILDYCIEDELGDSEAAFVPFHKLVTEFEPEEIQEYLKKVNNNEVDEKYNAFIVYNEQKLKKIYSELVKENAKRNNPKNKEELDNIFVDYITRIFTHERCHLNANFLVCDTNDPELDEYINGAEQSLDIIDKDVGSLGEWEDKNEVFIDTLSEMINNYEDGDSIEDCLYKVIKARGRNSQYNEFDDKMVLSMYVIFPQELTEWAMFGAYDQVRSNLLEEKITRVFGEKINLNDKEMNIKLKEYGNKINEKLSKEQIKMLEMLGVTGIEKKITQYDMKKVATSETAMSELMLSFLDINAYIQNLSKTEQQKNER